MNNTKFSIFFISLIIMLSSCGNGSLNFEKLPDGILLKLKKADPNSAQQVKLTVCSDEIIRVTASPGDTFSNRKSLMVNKIKWDTPKWSVEAKEGQIILSTSKIKAIINSESGAIAFYDLQSNCLLKERNVKGKFFERAKVLGENTFHVRQVFESPDDEAFYGLGQHQDGEMNYKGLDVDLAQLNIIDVCPFVVSNKKYGLLWDNNSRTKFGDIRDYESIKSLKLFNSKGEAGNLTVEFFKDRNFKNFIESRNVNTIDHDFIGMFKDIPAGFNFQNGAIRWSGEISSDLSGIHKLLLYSCSYTKVWLDDKLIVDKWRQNWLPWTNKLPLNMEADKKYKIKIEWIPEGGEYIAFKWLSPDKPEDKNILSLYSEVGDQLDYYFIYGEKTDSVIANYRELTGQAPMMPKWALGLWQCRERYKTQEELLATVKEFRKRQIPLDNIVQDWFYWPEDKWGDHDFDLSRFPDAAAMVKELHEKLNTHIMISVWPKFYVGTKNYELLDSKGWLYKRNVELKQKDWVGPGYVSTFYDAFNYEAGKLYWNSMNEKLFSKGFDAWWLDATEPDIHSNLSLEERQLRMHPTAEGSGARMLNAYSLATCRNVYEGQRGTNPDQRVFILTRSAYPGQQRYASATWSGDVASRWEDLKKQIPAGLNLCISGIPYWTTDIGGFAVERRYEKAQGADIDEWRELNTRWFQFGTFCPLFRVHGQFPLREMFNVAPENHPAFQTQLKYDKLRYRLMPYIYSLAGKVTMDGYTIMRALIMDFPEDKNVGNIADQFMFGPALLVNPVTDYKARKRNLYLPASTGWFNFQTGEYTEGGKNIEADAPLLDIPLYVKEGSIIPFGPALQYTTEIQADPITLYVYQGKDGEFTIYEDENVNYNYEKGTFSTIRITYTEESKTLNFEDRKGEFPGMLKERTFNIVKISKEKQKKLDFEAKPDLTIKYDGEKQSIKIN